MTDQTHRTAAGRTVYSWSFKHKRGTLTAYALERGAHPLVVTYTTPARTRELLGGSHGVTSWARPFEGSAPHGQIMPGLKQARARALREIDEIDCPAKHCRVHNAEPAVSGEGQTARCQSCHDAATATAARLLAETSA